MAFKSIYGEDIKEQRANYNKSVNEQDVAYSTNTRSDKSTLDNQANQHKDEHYNYTNDVNKSLGNYNPKDESSKLSIIEQIKKDIYKEYYHDISGEDVGVLPIKEFNYDYADKKPAEFLVISQLHKITYQENEDVLQKLTSIFTSSVEDESGIIIIVNSLPHEHQTEFYIGIITNNSGNRGVLNKTLQNGINSNFPGSELNTAIDVDELLKNTTLTTDENVCISTVSSVGSIRDKSKTEKKDFLQGFEKLMDTIQNLEYVGVFIARKVKDDIVNNVIYNHEQIYSALSQFRKSTISLSEGDSHTLTQSATHSLSNTINKTKSMSEGSSEATTIGAFGGVSLPFVSVGVSASDSSSKTFSAQDSTSQSSTSSLSDTSGIALAASYGKSVQLEIEDKTVSQLLDTLDKLLLKLRESKDYGMYDFGAYFLSTEKANVTIAANTYKAIITGEDSSFECDAINIWKSEQKEKIKAMKEYLSRGLHPVFVLPNGERHTASVHVTGACLPLHMGFPQKSVWGLSVVEHAEFGRNVLKLSHSEKENIFNIGKLYHMGAVNESNVELDKKELTKHTFITGSTGSGKSNTVYKMLEELCIKSEGTKFMVIEPAKGEYKDVFGGREDVTVYGTNPYKTPNLLQVNPFSFPEDIHVLEHIDRLVEIFNACWPMYAAMPAILKDAIEQAYEVCGWNLRTSKGIGKYPCFETLLDILPVVVDSSNYSSETASDYKGALITRVRSLTKGINGHIFENNIDLHSLFNENVIVDLSRIGSNETKSLIMGILVMQLQEFRMSENIGNNSNLRHVTVLEEAHNLLRRTSSEQSQESSNLQGKSVEMIANAIAEMRTYGEGFIIADQSPGLMDMSVIRNTNTKIIMRLPDEGDRQLVGKAAGLTDNQIIELSRLDTGVAAVYQNSWLEPVLCKVHRFDNEQPLQQTEYSWVDEKSVVIKKFLCNALANESDELSKEEVDVIRKWISSSLSLNEEKKAVFNYVLENKKLSDAGKMSVIYGVCKHSGRASRESMIFDTKNKLKSFGFVDDDYLIKETIEQLIIRNITHEGTRTQREQVQ